MNQADKPKKWVSYGVLFGHLFEWHSLSPGFCYFPYHTRICIQRSHMRCPTAASVDPRHLPPDQNSEETPHTCKSTTKYASLYQLNLCSVVLVVNSRRARFIKIIIKCIYRLENQNMASKVIWWGTKVKERCGIQLHYIFIPQS